MDHERVLLEFERRVLRHRVAAGLFFLLMIVFPMVEFTYPNHGWLVLGVFLGAAGVVGYLDWRSWRCPSCDRHLGGDWNYEYCPKCGVKLRA